MQIFFKKNNKLDRGFTLIEVLVSISIFTMSILGLMSVLTQGIANTSYAKQKIIAGYLAQEGIEYARNLRDTNVLYYDVNSTQNGWDHFRTQLNTCLSNNECGYDNTASLPGTFQCSSSSTQCRLYLNNGNYNANISAGVDSGFVRKIWFTQVNVNQWKIFSKVSWVQGSGSYNITFSEDVFNWVE